MNSKKPISRPRLTPASLALLGRHTLPNEIEFKVQIRRRSLRWHMALMVLGVLAASVSVSKLLLLLGVQTMLLRYVIAVCCAYGLFFLLVRLWLWYVGVVAARQSSSTGGGNWPIDFSGSSAGDSSGQWSGFGGGSSGGGGATDSWTEGSAFSSGGSSSSTSSSGSWNLGLDFDDEGGCLLLLALLLLVLLVGAICGVGVYLVYQAPLILTEAAFDAALAMLRVASNRATGSAVYSE
jgi:hypothetical protein